MQQRPEQAQRVQVACRRIAASNSPGPRAPSESQREPPAVRAAKSASARWMRGSKSWPSAHGRWRGRGRGPPTGHTNVWLDDGRWGVGGMEGAAWVPHPSSPSAALPALARTHLCVSAIRAPRRARTQASHQEADGGAELAEGEPSDAVPVQHLPRLVMRLVMPHDTAKNPPHAAYLQCAPRPNLKEDPHLKEAPQAGGEVGVVDAARGQLLQQRIQRAPHLMRFRMRVSVYLFVCVYARGRAKQQLLQQRVQPAPHGEKYTRCSKDQTTNQRRSRGWVCVS